MGQQQLLLLVLTLIVVGLAMVIGISIYTKGKKDSERDAANAALVDLASKAIAYGRTPESLNGGTQPGGKPSFSGFTMEAIGAKPRASDGGGYDLMGNGSCFTASVENNGNTFTAAWHPNGDCNDSAMSVLDLTVNGFDQSSITVEDGSFAREWRQTQ